MKITIDAQAFDAQLASLASSGATDLYLTSRGESHIRRAGGGDGLEICASPSRFALAMLIDHITGNGAAERLQAAAPASKSGTFRDLRFTAMAKQGGHFDLMLRLNAPKTTRTAVDAIAVN